MLPAPPRIMRSTLHSYFAIAEKQANPLTRHTLAAIAACDMLRGAVNAFSREVEENYASSRVKRASDPFIMTRRD